MPPDHTLDSVYAAIADPTRRAIIGLLGRGDTTVGAIADAFPMSFNGVSKHIKVLERAGLVARHVAGREHWLSLEPAPLGAASRWLEHYRAFWEARLEALEHVLVDEDRAPRRSSRKRSRRR